jgi:hypothetical protein
VTRHVVYWNATLDLRLLVEFIDVLDVMDDCKLVAHIMLVDVGNWLFSLVHFSKIYTTCYLQAAHGDMLVLVEEG